MPNPALINKQNSRIPHFLGLVDIYIELGKPKFYDIEPEVNENYRPDAYTIIDGEPIMIEYQRTFVTSKIMVNKVKQFVESYKRKEHDAKTLWIITDRPYKLQSPQGFTIVQKKAAAIA